MDQLTKIKQMMRLSGTGYSEYTPALDRMDCAPELLALLGAQESEAPATLEACRQWIHPDDWPGFLSRHRGLARGDDPLFDIPFRLVSPGAEERWVIERSAVLRRDHEGRPQLIGSLLHRCSEPGGELWEVQKKANSQYGLLQAVNKVAALLLGGYDDFRQVVVDALGVLGDSVQVHRAYVWKNSVIDGQLYCRRYAEWEADDTIRHEGDSGLVPYSTFFPDLDKLLASQSELLLHVSEMGGALAGFPGIEGVETLLAMPVMLYGEFWGFVGFDDMRDKRHFTRDELDILNSGGMMIGSGIMRNEMTNSLIEAREEALASVNAKTEFLSRMSHEIRTPMNAIIGMNEIAKSSGDPERVQYCLTRIGQASHQLLGIINDVLDLSKIESGKMEITPAEFDFEHMLQNVYSVVQPRLDEKGLSFSFDLKSHCTRRLISDELRLSQVLTNLLSNAVKFTPRGGKVILRTRITELGGRKARLHVEVEDTGIGISREDQAKLFRPFEQADGSITRRFGGTGLGLSICRNIIQLMGGDIWLESEPGVGSRFIFEVDVRVGGPIVARSRDLPDLRSVRVLVVDDSTDVLDYCRQILSGFGVMCHVAGGGEQALRMVEEADAPYNIIFLDWRMPGMDGIRTAEAIRERAPAETIVIMISVADWSDIKHQAAGVGVTRFLAKPLLPSSLFNTIVELVGQPEPQQREPEDEKHYAWHTKRVLMAEDIEINQEIVRTLLEPTGVAIDCACNGAQAVEMYCARPEDYDLVLMDVQMPGMDGYEATRRLRASGCSTAVSIPILAMTADAFSEDVQRCLEAGMNGHISKPIDVHELMDKLDMILGRA